MTKAKTGWLLLAILCLTSCAVADDTAWEKYMMASTAPRASTSRLSRSIGERW